MAPAPLGSTNVDTFAPSLFTMSLFILCHPSSPTDLIHLSAVSHLHVEFRDVVSKNIISNKIQ